MSPVNRANHERRGGFCTRLNSECSQLWATGQATFGAFGKVLARSRARSISKP